MILVSWSMSQCLYYVTRASRNLIISDSPPTRDELRWISHEESIQSKMIIVLILIKDTVTMWNARARPIESRQEIWNSRIPWRIEDDYRILIKITVSYPIVAEAPGKIHGRADVADGMWILPNLSYPSTCTVTMWMSHNVPGSLIE